MSTARMQSGRVIPWIAERFFTSCQFHRAPFGLTVLFGLTFSVNPAVAQDVVNSPVSPETVYWLPAGEKGLGVIDLNGWGFNTNTPGANATRPESASILTRTPTYNVISGIATLAHPCDPLICIHNQYSYPVGTGGYAYGPSITPGWQDPSDPGNPGTPVPGVNEMSSGFETLVRDSAGNAMLTSSSQLGTLVDLQVGEFLDTVYYDTQNFWNNTDLHTSFFGNGVRRTDRNLISDPPAPNPPPSRTAAGLPPIDTVHQQVIPGEEVLSGIQSDQTGWARLIPNELNPFGPDSTVFPHFPNGPAAQSSTQGHLFSSRQQIGNFLYASDTDNRVVHAINSNTMEPIASIPVPDPHGLAISPDNRVLFVTNPSDDSVSLIVADPRSPLFHQVVGRIPVGDGPEAISVQPDGLDVFVCNRGDNSISVIDGDTLSVRRVLTSLVNDPVDVALSPRQPPRDAPHTFGFSSGVYHAYISNFGGNNLLLYESGPGPHGADDIVGEVPTTPGFDIVEPRGLCYSPLPNPTGQLAGGVFFTHRDSSGRGRVSHLQFTSQAGGVRSFEITDTWGLTPALLAGAVPSDVSLADLNIAAYQGNPSQAPNHSSVGPAPHPDRTGRVNSHHSMREVPGGAVSAWQPDRLYVSFLDASSVQVLDPTLGGVILNTLESGGAPVAKLGTYWHQ